MSQSLFFPDFLSSDLKLVSIFFLFELVLTFEYY